MDFNDLKNKLLATFGSAADSTKDLAGKVGDATKDFAGKVGDKAKAGGRMAKLNLEIAQEKENRKKTYLEIGKLYYDTHKDAPEGFFIQLCEEVAAADAAIAAKEAEIAQLKEGFNAAAPDVEVEFEDVVANDEAAADPSADTGDDAVEHVAEEGDED